jgi:hypothetical protein
MRVVAIAVIAAFLAGPALAQEKRMLRYGEEEKEKSIEEKKAEKDAEQAYKRSLGNIPDSQKAQDPWGNVRGDAPKQDTKAPAAKKTKTGSSGN